jgi:hypothetical protein
MQTGMLDRPTVPFALSLVGVIVSAVAALIIGMAGSGMFETYGYGSMMGRMMGGYDSGTGMMNGYSPWGMSGWGVYTWLWLPLIRASIVAAAFGVFMMNSSRLGDIRIGSVLVLVAVVLTFPTAFGFVVGSFLLVLGGVLGLIWSPTRQAMS